MEAVLAGVLPVFGLLAIGYGAARWGFFDEAAQQGLSRFVFNFALPLLLFRSLARAELPSSPPWGLWLSYYMAMYSVYGFGMLVGKWCGRDFGEQSMLGFGACFSNTVLIGVPLILGTLGEPATLPMFLIIAIHGLLGMSTLTILMELAAGRSERLRDLPLNTLRGLARNTIVVGLAAGLLYGLSGLPLPTLLDDICALMGQAVTPCALFAMGAALTRYGLAGNIGMAVVLVVAKNLIHPLLVWWLATGFGLEPMWVATAVMVAALPIGINPFLFSQRYGVEVATVTSAVFLSTVMAVVTVTAWLWVVGST